MLLTACQLAVAETVICSENQFACNGNCIDEKLKCNGILDCLDGSDETFKACYNTTCDQKDLYRCGYGGCLDVKLKCNGIPECWDKSDENKFECANETQIEDLFTALQRGCGPEYALRCDGKTCLKWSQICNGDRDCKDGTDESLELCAYGACPPNSFRCENGACINRKRFCNREIDCADGSDEIPDLCSKAHKPKDDGKILPSEIWSPSGCALTPVAGMHVADYFSDFSYRPDAVLPLKSVVSMTCDKDYEIYGTSIKKCDNYEWSSDFKCLRVCKQSSVERNIRFTTQCIQNMDLTDCKQNTLLFNTTILVNCAPGFQPAITASQLGRHVCNETGLWFTEEANPKCEAICGVKSIHHPGITPWTVSIFKRISTNEDSYDFKCSGTILSPYVVLTAEKCVVEHFGNNDIHTHFSVAEGNHNVSYRQLEEHGYNLHNISNIHIVTHRRSEKVALLTLVKPFKFGAKVRPICLDTSSTFNGQTVESRGDFSQYKKGQTLTVVKNGEYTLTHLVVNNQLSYDINGFVIPIADDIAKSEQIP
ncbi:hypothetical protein ACLKA7_008951 [Drosophila subpalustris]